MEEAAYVTLDNLRHCEAQFLSHMRSRHRLELEQGATRHLREALLAEMRAVVRAAAPGSKTLDMHNLVLNKVRDAMTRDAKLVPMGTSLARPEPSSAAPKSPAAPSAPSAPPSAMNYADLAAAAGALAAPPSAAAMMPPPTGRARSRPSWRPRRCCSRPRRQRPWRAPPRRPWRP
jgi:hypothetical protein